MLYLGVIIVSTAIVVVGAQNNCKESCGLGANCQKTCQDRFGACMMETMHMVKMYQCQKCKVDCNVCCRTMETRESMLVTIEDSSSGSKSSKESYRLIRDYLRNEIMPMYFMSRIHKNSNSR